MPPTLVTFLTLTLLGQGLTALGQESVARSVASLQARIDDLARREVPAQERLESGLRILEELKVTPDPGRELRVRGHVALALVDLERFQEACPHLLRSIALAEELGDAQARMNCLGQLGLCLHNLGDLEAAVAHNLTLVALAEEHDDRVHFMKAANNLGLTYQKLGDFPNAIHWFDRTMTATEETGDRQALVRLLNNVGILHNDLGDHEKAADTLERARELYHEHTGGEEAFQLLSNLAIAERGLENLEAALDLQSQALELQRQAGLEAAVANSLTNLGVIHFDLGNDTEAIDAYQEALEIQGRLGLVYEEARTLGNLGEVYREIGEVETAIELAGRGLELADTVGSAQLRHQLLELLALGQQSSAQHAEALETRDEIKALERDLHAPSHARDLALLETGSDRRSLERRVQELEATGVAQNQSLLRQQRFQILLSVGALILLALGAVGWLRLRGARRRQRDLSHAYRELRTAIAGGTLTVDKVDRALVDIGRHQPVLPICASCKSIRDERDEWHSLEGYLTERAEISLTHGLCPGCAQQMLD